MDPKEEAGETLITIDAAGCDTLFSCSKLFAAKLK